MPKQADIRVQVPGCSAARFWDVVYERPEATERYHTSFNASTYTTVTPWSACQRTVNFAMPLKLPDFVKRMVGLDSVAVSEVQRVVWHGGGSFTVTSETQIANMMGAGRFTTALQLSVNEEPEQHLSPPPPMPRHRHPQPQRPQQPASTQALPAECSQDSATAATATAASATGTAVDVGVTGGVAADAPASPSRHLQKDVAAVPVERHLQLVYSVRCAASSMPWPMSATIENLMAEKALVSMQNFLDFCKQLLDEYAASAADSAAAAFVTSAIGAAAGTSEAPEAAAAAPGGHVSSPTTSSTAGAHPTLSPAPSTRGSTASSMRQRWPSITCSQDIGGDMGGAAGVCAGLGARLSALGATGEETPFHMGRQDTLGSCGGDVFWDAPETFAGGSSGASSGVVSPRHLPGGTPLLGHLQPPPAAARHTSTNGMVAPAGGHIGGSGQATCGSGVPVTAAAVAVADAHHLAVAVDHLTAAVAALDCKVEKALQLLQQQQEFQQQLQHNHTVDATANLSIRNTNNNDGGSGGGARHRRHGSTNGSGGGGGGSDDEYENDAPASARGSDFRWFLRVTIALILATVVVIGLWFLRLHVTGLRPHSGGASGGSGGPPGPLHKPSVLRISGEEYVRLGGTAVDAIGKAATAGGGGGSAGAMVRSARRMAGIATGGGGSGNNGVAGYRVGAGIRAHGSVHLRDVTNRAGASGGGSVGRRSSETRRRSKRRQR